MSLDTLSQQDAALMRALHNAKRSLIAVRGKQGLEEREVRNLVLDISCDSLQPLPVSIAAYLPSDTLKIVELSTINTLISEIDTVANAIRSR